MSEVVGRGRSEGAGYLAELYSEWSARMAANPDYTLADLRDIFDEWHKPTLEPERVSYRSAYLGCRPVIWAEPTASKPGAILYFHGGGFAVGSANSHRKLAGHLASHLGVAAAAIDYRLAPEHPFPAAIDDAISAYRELISRGVAPDTIIFAGDSAGGNLAISIVLKLTELGEALPSCVIAFSPWLDMEIGGPTMTSNEATDRLVNRPILEGMVEMYLAGSSRSDPLANPLKADLTGFPPLYLNAGSYETLLSDSQEMERRARESGVDVTLSIAEGMQHVFTCLAGRAMEADAALAKVAQWHQQRFPTKYSA